MNAMTVNAARKTNLLFDLEPAINDLARLGFVTEILLASLMEDLACYAKAGLSAADALSLVERKREVVIGHVEDVEIKTRQLREEFYAAV